MLPLLVIGTDELIQLFGAFVALLVALAAYRMRKLAFSKQYFWLVGSFGLMALGFLTQVIVAGLFFTTRNLTTHISLAELSNLIDYGNDLLQFGTAAHVFLFTFAYLLLVVWALKLDRYTASLMGLLSLLLIRVGIEFPKVFYYTSLIFLFMVAVKAWFNSKPKYVAYSFALIALANVFWMFQDRIEWFFYAGYASLFFGFAVMLSVLIRVMKK